MSYINRESTVTQKYGHFILWIWTKSHHGQEETSVAFQSFSWTLIVFVEIHLGLTGIEIYHSCSITHMSLEQYKFSAHSQFWSSRPILYCLAAFTYRNKSKVGFIAQTSLLRSLKMDQDCSSSSTLARIQLGILLCSNLKNVYLRLKK